MIDEGRHTKVSFSSVFLHTGSFAQNFFQTDLIKRCMYQLKIFSILIANRQILVSLNIFPSLDTKDNLRGAVIAE